jgi:predicted nuclease with TOPRIM domain
MKRFFRNRTEMKELKERLRQLEEKVAKLEEITDERDALWLFIDEMRAQEVEAQKSIQAGLEEMLVRSLTPQGDA